jgi:hypothetical protein
MIARNPQAEHAAAGAPPAFLLNFPPAEREPLLDFDALYIYA